MIYFVIFIFLKVIEYVEILRNHLTNYFKNKIPLDNKHILKILNEIDVTEKNLKNYNPITLIVAFVISLMITNFIIKKIKQIWRNISKHILIKTHSKRLRYLLLDFY